MTSFWDYLKTKKLPSFIRGVNYIGIFMNVLLFMSYSGICKAKSGLGSTKCLPGFGIFGELLEAWAWSCLLLIGFLLALTIPVPWAVLLVRYLQYRKLRETERTANK